MSLSKVYSVKSNAARAAAKIGLTRDDVWWHVELGLAGWAFEVPEPTSAACEPKEIERENTLVETQPLDHEAEVSFPPSVEPIPVEFVTPAEPPLHRSARNGKKALTALLDGWMTPTEIFELTGWQTHTIRGWVSKQAKKLGITPQKRCNKGKVVAYTLSTV